MEQAFQSLPRRSFWRLPGWRPHDHDMPTKLHHGLHRVVHPPIPLSISQSRQPPSLLTFVTVSVSPSKSAQEMLGLNLRSEGDDGDEQLLRQRKSEWWDATEPLRAIKNRFTKHRRLKLARNQIHVRLPRRRQTWMGIITPRRSVHCSLPWVPTGPGRVRGPSRVFWSRTTPR
jgi:hypothetical protein